VKNLDELIEIVRRLRGPDGCPWDKVQTHKTLAPYAVEETYELVDAIESGSDLALREELGDVLFQVLLHAEVAAQRGAFSLDDVALDVGQKLVRRHPHVFGDVKVKDAAEVLANWAAIKEKEKASAGSTLAGAAPSSTPGVFASIPRNLPSLQRSQKIGHKTIRYNFDWNNVDDVLAKVDEEIAELKQAISDLHGASGARGAGDLREAVQLEIGDVLFSVVQVARHLDLDAEQALRMTNRKFETRFATMQDLVAEAGLNFPDLSVNDLEVYWQKAKEKLARGNVQ
jgi:tetrapyrrole methylase family protein / MazG family protein